MEASIPVSYHVGKTELLLSHELFNCQIIVDTGERAPCWLFGRLHAGEPMRESFLASNSSELVKGCVVKCNHSHMWHPPGWVRPLCHSASHRLAKLAKLQSLLCWKVLVGLFYAYSCHNSFSHTQWSHRGRYTLSLKLLLRLSCPFAMSCFCGSASHVSNIKHARKTQQPCSLDTLRCGWNQPVTELDPLCISHTDTWRFFFFFDLFV